MARTVSSPPRTSTGSSPTRRHSSSVAATAAAAITTAPTPRSISTSTTSTIASASTNSANTANIITTTNTTTNTSSTAAAAAATTTTANRSAPGVQRAADRNNIAIAPASSNTSSPIYSATSSPSISPGVSHQPTSSYGTMGPTRSDSRTNALAFDLAPTSTPTGRISKAKKGKRVHACEFPGCGKIFTRAEHRRRHELNHNPDASYRCPQQGCGKSFHRLDLLQRHQERHELEASTESTSHKRYPSHTSVMSETSAPQLPPTSMASPRGSESAPRTSGGVLSIGSMVNPHSYATGDHSGGFGMDGIPSYVPYFGSAIGPFYTDHRSSPLPENYPHRQSISASSSVRGFDHNSSSPMVTASMTAPWEPADVMPPNADPIKMFDGVPSYTPSAAVNTIPISLSDMDGYEWNYIRGELQLVPGLLSSPNRTGVPDTMRWHCLELYWQCFHPTYPIVHRPTFLTGNKPPPLLASAMVAIGSYYDMREDAKQYSLALLEIATKVLRNRSKPTTNKSRIEDIQTVVLLEILSTFCARQTSVQMSTRFRTLFANLSTLDQSSLGSVTNPLSTFCSLRANHTPEELATAQNAWIIIETRTRILHACTVLDSQQTILFDQSPTVRKHNGLRVNTANAKKVNLPCDDELWDASPIDHWAALAANHKYVHMVGGKPTEPSSRQAQYSYFQQEVINAHTEGGLKCHLDRGRITSATGEQILCKTTFNYHATEMCRHTPIRQLLTVTGESWVYGRKVEKPADYQRAKQELRKWLESSAPSKKGFPESIVAHWHALKLLRSIELQNPGTLAHSEVFGTTHMLHENWAVFLASLVCWAHGHRKAGSEPAMYNIGRLPGPQALTNQQPQGVSAAVNDSSYSDASAGPSCLNHPDRAAQEAETYLIFTNLAAPTALKDLEPLVLSRTQGLLESVRGPKIATCTMGGLMNDAEQVLLKLVEGKKSIAF